MGSGLFIPGSDRAGNPPGSDLKWREIIQRIQQQAWKIFGHGLGDSLQDRVENMAEIERVLARNAKRK